MLARELKIVTMDTNKSTDKKTVTWPDLADYATSADGTGVTDKNERGKLCNQRETLLGEALD